MGDNRLDYRPWDDLLPDTLGLIFRKLPLDEILNVVPGVCKTWADVVRGPYCWQEIDIEDWSRYRRAESIDRMLLLLLSRSSGSLQKLCVCGLSTSVGLSLIADNAKSLQNLLIPMSDITDSMVEQVADRLSSLTSLDLSFCTKIGAPALTAFGKHCKLLTRMKRNMHPWDISTRKPQDDEAFAIASSMPKLKHLELAYLMVTAEGVHGILTNCNELELLDMRGCWNVKLDEVLLRGRSGLKVVGPLFTDTCGKTAAWDEFLNLPSSLFGFAFDEMDYDCYANDSDNEANLGVEELGLMFYDDEPGMG